MIRSAITTESATPIDDCAIGHEDSSRMVIAWNGSRRQLGERVGGRIEELRYELRGIVAERVCVYLSTHDENGTVGENDAVRECALIGHVPNRLHRSRGWRCTDGDDMSIGSCVDVLVRGGAAHDEDLAIHRVIHGSVATHGITIARTRAGGCLRAAAGRAIPVHGNRGPCLKDVTILPTE